MRLVLSISVGYYCFSGSLYLSLPAAEFPLSWFVSRQALDKPSQCLGPCSSKGSSYTHSILLTVCTFAVLCSSLVEHFLECFPLADDAVGSPSSHNSVGDDPLPTLGSPLAALICSTHKFSFEVLLYGELVSVVLLLALQFCLYKPSTSQTFICAVYM